MDVLLRPGGESDALKFEKEHRYFFYTVEAGLRHSLVKFSNPAIPHPLENRRVTLRFFIASAGLVSSPCQLGCIPAGGGLRDRGARPAPGGPATHRTNLSLFTA